MRNGLGRNASSNVILNFYAYEMDVLTEEFENKARHRKAHLSIAHQNCILLVVPMLYGMLGSCPQLFL